MQPGNGGEPVHEPFFCVLCEEPVLDPPELMLPDEPEPPPEDEPPPDLERTGSRTYASVAALPIAPPSAGAAEIRGGPTKQKAITASVAMGIGFIGISPAAKIGGA
jgi:hypothetical protein